MNDPVLVVGLGNPGPRYQHTRHNIGFMVLDTLAQELAVTFRPHRWNAEIARATIKGADLLLLKPQTYMNRSGDAVIRFCDYFRIPLDHLLVVHDDLDLPLGRLKAVARGGAGGHKGVRSLIARLGSQDFARIKIGIGRPGQTGPHTDMPIERFVTAPFTAEEREIVDQAVKRAGDGILLFARRGIQETMNLINSRS
jgi:PTH1 family peptidyl-tRNA hydrolase